MKGGKFLESYFNLQKNLYNDFSKRSVLLMQKGKFYEIYGLVEDTVFSEVCDLLGIFQSRTDKSKPLSDTNPKMAGFPIESIDRHLKTLTENDYIVQIVDETKDGDIKASKNGAAREITKTVSSTTLIDDLSLDTKWILYIILLKNEMSFSIINLQIGELQIYPDQAFNIDVINEALSKYKCGEIIVHTEEKIDLPFSFIHVNKPSNLRVSYKEEFLQKFYKKTIGISILESLNLERYQLASNSLVYLLEHTLKYDPSLIRKISKPYIINNDKILNLPENAITQLDLYKVIKEIDYTTTPMGSRYLKKRILYPNIENISYKTLDISTDLLKNIGDIDKLYTKIYSLKANIANIIKLYKSLLQITELLKDPKVKVPQATLINLEKAIKFIDKRLYTKEENELIFREKYIESIDKILEEKKDILNDINKIKNELHPFLQLYHKKDKMYFIADKDTKKEINSKVTATKLVKGWKITSSKSENYFYTYIKTEEKYEKEVREGLKKFCREFSDFFNDFMTKLSKRISEIDFSVCCNILIQKYGFNIPVIQKDKNLSFEGLFHPISKNLYTGFISQDLTLSGGMLLYGVNFSGKSTLLRSVGIAVILAQAGLPCPAKKMTFSPFSRLYTKISLGDNYLKGQSTFTNEIYEMKKMVNVCDENTLILADELCSGTEINSAVALVASSIMSISKKKGKFIFTTHYHELAELEEIKNTTTEIYHMSVERTNEGGFKFNRKLEKGKCGDIYGIEIAIHMDMESEFIKNASKIRSKLIGGELKKSRYNSDVYMSECKLCGEKRDLHTHHIKFQKDFSSMDKTKNYKGNLIVLCENCHVRLHKNELQISGYVETTEGIQITN